MTLRALRAAISDADIPSQPEKSTLCTPMVGPARRTWPGVSEKRGTTPCMLRGAGDLRDVCKKKIGPKDVLSADGRFTWQEVECLGACCNAPMVQINDDFYEDLTPELLGQVLDDLAAGKQPKKGPQNGRRGSMAEGGPTTLKDIPLTYDMAGD